MMRPETHWRPSASLNTLRLRASLLARIRAFFARLDVLEVDTPVLSRAASTDPVISSFKTSFHAPGMTAGEPRYLQPSPEFPMKRLLAAGSGSIYQICKVFRDGETGARHNPEFTLLEWYRTGFDHLDLIDEVEQFLKEILAGIMPIESVHHWYYRDLFIEIAAIDPFATSPAELKAMLESKHNVITVGLDVDESNKDAWLDLVMTHVIEPQLGNGLVFIRDYPASQAALARLRSANPVVAARFEVYLDGIELANGFHELSDAAEQRLRFKNELGQRQHAGIEIVTMDEHLLSALDAGLPDCAGVALGLDRLLMLACGTNCVQDVMAFPFDIA